MAWIQYSIHKDAKDLTATPTVTLSVQSIGPGDKITFVTDFPGTLIQCKDGSPFAYPSVGDLYQVAMNNTKPEPLLVARSTVDPNACHWECGNVDDTGEFTAWNAGAIGPVFPPVGSD